MLSLINLEKTYKTKHREIVALKNISLEIDPNEILGVIGRLAAGKTTLLRCINLLERPSLGEIVIDGCNLLELNNNDLFYAKRSFGTITSSPSLLSSRSVYDNIAFPLELSRSSKSEIEQAIYPVLNFLGLAAKRNSFPDELTEAQKQRVAIARALVHKPKFLLCDEPTENLDAKSRHSLLQLLKDIYEKFNVGIIYFTQEMDIIKFLCHRAVVLHHGEIVEQNKVIHLYAKPQSQLCKELIKSSSRLELPLALRKRLRPNPSDSTNPIVRMSFLGANAEEALIAHVIQQYQLTVNILQGHMEIIQGEELGIMIVEFTGDAHNISKAIEFLQSKQLFVEVLGHANRTA